MAYPYQEAEGITREQAETLRELNSFQQFNESAAWKKVSECLQRTCDVARDELLACEGTADMETRAILALRWQEREAIRRGLMTFVEAHLAERQRLVEEIKEQDEHTSDSGDPGTDHS